MKKPKRRFVLRTIKNGKIKINGKIFKPFIGSLVHQNIEYDGRLDDRKFAFGLYWNGEIQAPYVQMWGHEALYKAKDEDTFNREYDNRPDVIDGIFPWTWWDAEREPL